MEEPPKIIQGLQRIEEFHQQAESGLIKENPPTARKVSPIMSVPSDVMIAIDLH